MTGYDQDFYEWTQETARSIAAGRFDEIDRAALADEVGSLGNRDKREVRSRLAVIAMHMLKQRFQPERETYSWNASILQQRFELEMIFLESPSLKTHAAQLLAEGYKIARRRATAETGIALKTFPETCEWTVDEVLGDEPARRG